MPNPNCVLWPPNGVWHHVASISALDGLSGVAEDSLRIAVDISDGSHPEIGDDVRIVSGSSVREVWLRARRLGKDDGRRYLITPSATDLAGNLVRATAACDVPHDQRD
jgi:hypothetical protein